MNRDTLHNIFKSPYQSSIWKGFLKQLFRDISASYFETPVDLKDDSLVKHKDVEHIWEYGDITLSDGRVIKFYEVELKENQQVTKNRVGLRNIMSSEIGFGYIDGAIITYYNKKASDWRFTFISKSLYWDADNNEVKTETHPKRYTYLLGQNETVKTAVNQFEWLFNQINSREITLEDILKAFSVEKLSKEFYNGYFHQYETFVSYIVDNQNAFTHFLNHVSINGTLEDRHEKAEHLVSDFVKKFLGRIVFLFFLQKKGWMGVSLDKDWGEGQLDFLFRLFEEFPDKNNFYEKALAPLFFETLNADRSENNDIYSVTNTRIPYLNGGLFEKDNVEPIDIQFEPQRFIDLLAFFSQYNFTVDESSPDDQDIGVDPEMLGHIFENLLEDNKDKGAFYTPKEIVHYMTQESLIEYLHTHLSTTEKEDITIFVKQKKQGKLTENELEEINALLSKVKILDPAIGSGAFPMGLLHEIFALKGLIAFEQGYEAWSPARVKERIIENSIYGVDIEEGAVDIAQLRFWLSLVVDEPTPRPLPNLDYKIICGNSLISRYDLDTPIDQVFREFNKGRAEEDKVDLAKYKALVNDYMHEANHDKKEEFKQLIEDVKSAFKTYFSSKESKKLNDKKYELNQYINVGLFEHKQTAAEKRRNAKLRKEIGKLEQEKKDREEAKIFKEAVEWRFEFPNLLDKEGNFEGFDLVIGNPPYLKERDSAHIFEPVNQSPLGQKWHQGKMDYWFYFLHQSMNLINDKGVISFITSRYWLNSQGAKKLINRVEKELSFTNVVDIGKLKVFQNVAGHHMIHIYSKIEQLEFSYKKISNDVKLINREKDSDIKNLVLSNETVFKSKGQIVLAKSVFDNFFDFKTLGELYDTSIGVQESVDRISKKQFSNSDRVDIEIGQGVFVLSENEVDTLNLSIDEKKVLQKYIDPNDVGRYFLKPQNKKYLIYSDKFLKQEIESDNSYSNIKAHLDNLVDFITSSNKPYGIHRARSLKYFTEPKIIFKGMFKSPDFTYDEDNYFFGFSFSSIIKKNNNSSLKYLLAILNSKLANKWFYTFGKLRGVGVDIGVEKLRTFPVAKTEYESVFDKVVDNVLAVNKFSSDLAINEHVPNAHISETFEEVIDAMVFELYFPEEFKKAGLYFIQYAERDFESIEGKLPEEQTTIIHNAYQKLREKDNEIRNNLKAMKIELRDLLMPILTV